jgi:hypothetical protein
MSFHDLPLSQRISTYVMCGITLVFMLAALLC